MGWKLFFLWYISWGWWGKLNRHAWVISCSYNLKDFEHLFFIKVCPVYPNKFPTQLLLVFMTSTFHPNNPSRLGLKRSNVKRRWYPQMLCGGLHVRRALGRWPEDDVTTVFCWIYIVSFCTPLKINMEHNHGGLEVWKIMFLSKWGIGRFHVNLPGCNFAPWTMVNHNQTTIWENLF